MTSYTAVKVVKKETYRVKNLPEQVYVMTIEHIICLSKSWRELHEQGY
jgi:hypothetical protein